MKNKIKNRLNNRLFFKKKKNIFNMENKLFYKKRKNIMSNFKIKKTLKIKIFKIKTDNK